MSGNKCAKLYVIVYADLFTQGNIENCPMDSLAPQRTVWVGDFADSMHCREDAANEGDP